MGYMALLRKTGGMLVRGKVLFLLILFVFSGCTNVVPQVGWLRPPPFTPESPSPGSGSPDDRSSFKSTISMEEGQFVARGEDIGNIKEASLSNNTTIVPLQISQGADKTVMAPSSITHVQEGVYTLSIEGVTNNLGRFVVDLAPNSVDVSKIQPGTEKSVLMTENGRVTWDISIVNSLQNTIRNLNNAIYSGNQTAIPPYGSVDLIAERPSASVSYVQSARSIALGGANNYITGSGSTIIGGSNNSVSVSNATILNSHNITSMNHGEFIFGGSKEVTPQSPFTSIIHLLGASDGTSNEIALKLADGTSVVQFQGNAAGSCHVELVFLPSVGQPIEGDGNIYFKNQSVSTAIYNKSNTSFKIGVDDYLVLGIPEGSQIGFKVAVKNTIGVVQSGNYIARMVCLVAQQ